MPSCGCRDGNERWDAPKTEWGVPLYLAEDQYSVRRNYCPSPTEPRHIDSHLFLTRQVKQPKRGAVPNKNLLLASRQRRVAAIRKSRDSARVQLESEKTSTELTTLCISNPVACVPLRAPNKTLLG